MITVRQGLSLRIEGVCFDGLDPHFRVSFGGFWLPYRVSLSRE
jgi:hypothetical protein